MKGVGWVFFLMTLLYPLDALHTWYLIRDVLAAEGPPAPRGAGMAFDLKTQNISCGIVGWLGGVGTLLSLVWLLVALVGWVGRRMRHEAPLALQSRFVVAVVLAGVLIAVATQQFFERVLGILFM